jgi:signal peptidase II
LTSKRLKRTTRNTFIFVLAAAAAILIDQVSKALVVAYVEPGRSITMVPHVLSLTHSTNTGGAFGLMRGSGQIVFLAALVVVGLTMAWFFVFRGRKSF